MKVSELFGRAEIEFPQDAANIEVNEIITDSRKVVPGCVFVCIKGLHSDGHDFIGEAISAGAKVIVAEHLVRDVYVGGAAAIIVDNTRRAAALLYNSLCHSPADGMRLIAVTGTNGKTSVCSMMKRIFERAGKTCGMIGTLGCFAADERIVCTDENPLANMTTPDPEVLYRVLKRMKEAGVEYVFIEASSHALALNKLDALKFEVAIFTNLTVDHLDFHGDIESYFAAKVELFSKCRKALINIDDKRAGDMIASARCEEIYTFSAEKNADFSARNIRMHGAYGSEYLLRSLRGETDIELSLAGRFQIPNSLAAASAALLCGIDSDAVQSALREMRGIDGRLERVELGEDADIKVFIDYAHTPDALEKLLMSIRELREADERIVLLFGCGGERDRSKRAEMAHIASRLSDFTIITSDNSRGESSETIISDILRGIDKESEYKVIVNRAEAIEYALATARRGDILAFAGKGHERYEIDSEGKHPFDERKIAIEAYKKYRSHKD